MYRVFCTALLSAAVLGCGDSVGQPNSPLGSFTMMENSANDLCSQILAPGYKARSDLGTDSDRIGMALSAFMKEAEGGPYAADAKSIAEKMRNLDKLAASRAPVAKQREAAKDLQESIAALKAKM